MKTNLFKATVLAACLLAALTSASAETLHARIPFGFSAAGTTMPAGAYSIRPIPNAPSALLFENEDTKVQAIVFARRNSSALVEPEAPLVFITSAGERMELTNVAAAGWTYEISAHPASKSLKGVALAITGK